MKIAILQQAGEHTEDLESKESFVFKNYFKKIGIESEVTGLNHKNFANFHNIINDSDLIFVLENYEIKNWIPDLSKYSNKLKVFWSMDSHLALDQHVELCKKHKIDIVLHGIHDHANYFKDRKTHYFPLACIPEKTRFLSEIDKVHDIGFCGSLISDRAQWLKLINDNFNLKTDIRVLGEEMVKAINSYKLHFNKTLSKQGVNARVVQTLACKTFLITNKTDDMKYQFKTGKHFVTYENENELLEKIKFYLENFDVAQRIAEEGHKHVIENHTFENRVKDFQMLINKHI